MDAVFEAAEIGNVEDLNRVLSALKTKDHQGID
ncbi:MAG: hypothetical protein ACJAW3_001351 [Lentimonas sp.]|jgi:hypothetical protein